MPRLGKLGFLLLVAGAAPLFPATLESFIFVQDELSLTAPGFTGTIIKNFSFSGFDDVVGTLQSVRISGVGGAGEGMATEIVGQSVDLSVEGIIGIFSATDFGGSSNTGPLHVDKTITDPFLLPLFESSDVTLVSTWEVFGSLSEGGMASLGYSFNGIVEYTYSTPSTVPEPAQCLLVALGLVSLVMLRRYRAKASA
jgi:hypothetical protein